MCKICIHLQLQFSAHCMTYNTRFSLSHRNALKPRKTRYTQNNSIMFQLGLVFRIQSHLVYGMSQSHIDYIDRALSENQ